VLRTQRMGSSRWGSRRAAAVAMTVLAFLAVGWRSAARGAQLPDGRAYEMVSPPQKNGGDVMTNSQRIRAATGGDAIGFASLSGFGDVHGMGQATDYVAVRDDRPGTNGWTTHGITPTQAPLTVLTAINGFDPLYMGDYSDDLSKGVFRAWSPLTDTPLVQDVVNLYARSDLLSPGAGSYQLVTDCPGCTSPLTDLGSKPWLAGTSSDFGHIVFESANQLTIDATPGVPNLYEWDHGVVRLAGILPDGACGSPPCPASQSQAGRGASNLIYTPHTISADGSRIIFTDPSTGTDGTDGTLYLRTDHAVTVQINASERTPPDPGGSQPATYWDASTDGSRIFFTSGEALTDDAPVNGDRKLYRYDVTPDAQGHHLTFISKDQEPSDNASTSDNVAGAIGASADGRAVYFIGASGQLVSGAPTTEIPGADDRLYVWRDGTLSYVGALPAEDEKQDIFVGTSWGLNVKLARVAPDGRSLLFMSTSGAGLTGYDHGLCPDNGLASGACRELYAYRADATPHLQCASCNPSGAAATTDASDVVRTASGAATTASHLNHPLSDDGRWVFFSTAEALVPEDTNGTSDAYEFDTQTGTVHLLSTGKDLSPSYFAEASASGRDAFILTRQRLTGWDIDGGYDLYDARVGGGFPEPPLTVPCSGEACRGAAVEPPPPFAPASQAIHGTGNVKAAKPRHRKHRGCRRGFVRKRVHGRVRCVRRHHHRRHRR
jgi:hypothetical protein